MARTAPSAPPAVGPRRQLETFLSRYEPGIKSLARAILRKMEAAAARCNGTRLRQLQRARRRLWSQRTGKRLSVFDCVYARWVNLYFHEGSLLSDPEGLLKGSGNRVRHITLRQEQDFDGPGVQALITQALNVADPPMPSRAKRRAIVIKSVSAKQRPRRSGPSRPRRPRFDRALRFGFAATTTNQRSPPGLEDTSSKPAAFSSASTVSAVTPWLGSSPRLPGGAVGTSCPAQSR